MKVAILTMFTGLRTTYSLVNIVAEQLRMLLDANVPTKLLVSEQCLDEERFGIFLDERIEWVKITSKRNGQLIHWKDYSRTNEKIHDGFFEEADIYADDFVRNLSDVDFCLMHDILYLGTYLVLNVAVRKAQQQLPNVRFIAFTHSVPYQRPLKTEWPFSARFTEMPNTIYAYPTVSGIPALAKQYNVPEGICRVVNNSVDALSFFSDEVKTVAKKVDLLSPDFLAVYPARLSLGKQFEKVASFCGALKTGSDRNVKVLFCDFPSKDIEPKTYKTLIKLAGCKNGLDTQDIVFTSDCGFEKGFPRKGVLELFSLSNLFICPSLSETFSLTLLEAASQGNFLVVNEAVPALEEMGKKLNAYFIRWDGQNSGFRSTEIHHESEEVYIQRHAGIIVNRMRENSVIHAKTLARQRFSPQWVWRNQLEPLLRR